MFIKKSDKVSRAKRVLYFTEVMCIILGTKGFTIKPFKENPVEGLSERSLTRTRQVSENADFRFSCL